MGNQMENLHCSQCGDMIGKFDYRTKTYVPDKKPFRNGKNGVELKCAGCDRFVTPITMKDVFNPLSLPKK